ncbi:hypothetical protein SASPL_103738 [Salvia splendens]|uniref:Fungal lipase-type domain-containing protein n=1 Tax=Salvia splendens TaxID=180675 RepID=A0A8X9A9Z7_SALSN|nr:hypothetical protein SASPL_103738 [Salvia splendens]
MPLINSINPFFDVVLRLPISTWQPSTGSRSPENDCPFSNWSAQFDFRELFNKGMESRSWLIIAILVCSVTLSSCRELKVTVKHKHNHKQHDSAKYNHTLATILVQYASAVRVILKCIMSLLVYMSDLTELFAWTCSRCNGLTEGFEILELIVDVKWCLQGFVGFAANLNAVVIAFRGTQETSIQNWVEDLFWKQLDINYPGVDGAMVHHGFYNAYNDSSLRPGVLSAVQLAKELYGDTNIMVTGHSMGGAMAALCGLDLRVILTLGEQQKVQVMTFGQPRIGNAVFASYYSQVVPDTFRVTHGNDMVPHLPPYYSYFPQKTYHHFPREIRVELENLPRLAHSVSTKVTFMSIRLCLIHVPYRSGSAILHLEALFIQSRRFVMVLGKIQHVAGKYIFPSKLLRNCVCDPLDSCYFYYTKFRTVHLYSKCFMRFSKPFCRSVRGNSIADHLIYYGVEMGCNESTSTCRIVMDRGLAAYGSTDVDGNFVILRDPPKSVLKLNADGGNRHTLV